MPIGWRTPLASVMALVLFYRLELWEWRFDVPAEPWLPPDQWRRVYPTGGTAAVHARLGHRFVHWYNEGAHGKAKNSSRGDVMGGDWWEVRSLVQREHGQGRARLTRTSLHRAADLLREHGFIVLRASGNTAPAGTDESATSVHTASGATRRNRRPSQRLGGARQASLFSDAELAAAEHSAMTALRELQGRTTSLRQDIQAALPWHFHTSKTSLYEPKRMWRRRGRARAASSTANTPYTPPGGADTLGKRLHFAVQEARSYTGGRLDMPLLHRAHFNASLTPWRDQPDLTALCEMTYRLGSCKQTMVGALWNFPGASNFHWHRDFPGDYRLLTAITATKEYSVDAGWLGMQRLTHEGAPFAHLPSLSSPGHAEPQPVTTVLHKGDTLLFTATTKHAATPNPSYETRCLLYTYISVGGRADTRNHKLGTPTLDAFLADESNLEAP